MNRRVRETERSVHICCFKASERERVSPTISVLSSYVSKALREQLSQVRKQTQIMNDFELELQRLMLAAIRGSLIQVNESVARFD